MESSKWKANEVPMRQKFNGVITRPKVGANNPVDSRPLRVIRYPLIGPPEVTMVTSSTTNGQRRVMDLMVTCNQTPPRPHLRTCKRKRNSNSVEETYLVSEPKGTGSAWSSGC